MISIIINKYLSYIYQDEYRITVKTEDLYEIIGINSFDDVEDIPSKEVEERLIAEFKKADGEHLISWIKSRSRHQRVPLGDPHCMKVMKINDKKYFIGKLMESFDLTFQMFNTLAGSASLYCTVVHRANRLTSSYIQIIRRAIGDAIFSTSPSQLPQDVKSVQIDRRAEFEPEDGKIYSNTIISKRELQFRGFSSDPMSLLPIDAIDGNLISHLFRSIQHVRESLTFYYKDEEWMLIRITEDEIKQIFEVCKHYDQQAPDRKLVYMYAHNLTSLVTSLMTRGAATGLIELENAQGKKRIFQLEDLTPLPEYVARKEKGKYGLVKTWSSDIEAPSITL
jgi:hypothetical protein